MSPRKNGVSIMHVAPRAHTAQQEYRRILTYAGMVMLVSFVANAVLGISETQPVFVPVWGAGVAGAFWYLLARHERIPDLSRIASTAVPLTNTDHPTEIAPGIAYAVSGTVTSTAHIHDEPYHRGGDYLALTRITEVLRREERTNRDRLVWHEVHRHTVYAPEAHIGNVAFTPDENLLASMPTRRITPNPIMEQLPGCSVDATHLYEHGQSGARLSPNTIVSGDRRITHDAVPSDMPATLFGVPDGTRFAPFVAADGHILYTLWAGSLSEAITAMRRNHTSARRATRLVVAVVEIIAWTVLCAYFNIGDMVGLSSRGGAFTPVVLGGVVGISSVMLISILVNPRRFTAYASQ